MSQQQSETPESSSPRVVVGGGPDALRAAAVFAQAGQAVHLLQLGPTPSGLQHPDLPLGLGRVEVDTGERALVESISGPLVEAPEAQQGIAFGGTVRRLPMSRLEAGRLLPAEQSLHTGRTWARTRFRNVMAEVIGGGQEERTYRDWVVRRFGEPAWHHLYRPYAERRWGASCESLSVSVARVHHGQPRGESQQVVGGGPATALDQAREIIENAGGTISTGVIVESLEVVDGKVASLTTNIGEVALDGGLAVSAAPDVVAAWLGDQISEGVRVDSAQLRLLTRVQVLLRGNVDGLPQAVHVLDEDAPFWRVVTPYGLEQAAIFHATYPYADAVPPEGDLLRRFVDAASRFGLGDFSVDGARVEVVPDWQPLWLEGTHARLRRLLMAWRALGIQGVGRGGSFSSLDAAQEIALAHHVATEEDPDLWEYHRLHLSPPSSLPDLHAHITRFVER